jgi:hypothetical protein
LGMPTGPLEDPGPLDPSAPDAPLPFAGIDMRLSFSAFAEPFSFAIMYSSMAYKYI